MIRFFCFMSLLFMLSLSSTAKANDSCEMTIKHPMLESSKDNLIFKLFSLSISKVTTKVCYEQLNTVMSEARKSKSIEKGFIDVQWASADSFANDLLIPVNIPIFKGILGYRIFVIRKNDQHLFENVNSLSDLQKFIAGQGKFWGDTKVLEHAGLPVVTSTRGRHLWQMLASKRFDYLPLAIHEPWQDLKIRPELDLVVEKNLMLVYPMALFFYVNKDNEKLYQYLEQGMRMAIKDGSYDAILKSSEMIKSAAKYANIETRKIIYINNPDINNANHISDYKKQTEELLRLITH